MIIMDLKVDNLLGFRNFHINMAYPKKIVKSYIPEEHLNEFPNFRYKKVNIILGTNSTGKTSLGKVLMGIFNFIDRKTIEQVSKLINDRNKEASFQQRTLCCRSMR